MTREYPLKYGDGKVYARLDDTQVIAELRGTPTPAIGDVAEALYAALDAPVESASLRESVSAGEKIAIVISDMSRFWMRQDLVIPHLVRYLEEECGVSCGDMTIVVANGTHVGGDEGELRKLVTDAVYDRVRVKNHDCRAKDLAYLGTTSLGTDVRVDSTAAEADRVICLGACAHHIMAGFGGGRKSILPGISGIDTIRQNHAHSLDADAPRSNPLIGNGVLKGNPLHQDMCEAAMMMKSLFMVNLVMNADMQLAKIFAGHWLHSWEKGCEAVNGIYNVPVKEKADVVITSCGGYPKDMSLYQGTKTIDNVESGLKEGGTLIVAMEARDGGGPAEYFDWINPLKEGKLYETLKADFTIPGYIFFLNCEQARKYRVMLLTSVAPELVAPMGIEAFSDMETLLAAAKLDGKSIYVIENGSTVIPCVKG